MIGEIITQVIDAIHPMVIKSVSTVTAAVATAFKHMKAELQAVETMKGGSINGQEGEGIWQDYRQECKHNTSNKTDKSSTVEYRLARYQLELAYIKHPH